MIIDSTGAHVRRKGTEKGHFFRIHLYIDREKEKLSDAHVTLWACMHMGLWGKPRAPPGDVTGEWGVWISRFGWALPTRQSLHLHLGPTSLIVSHSIWIDT